jgi:hypothetical protein
VIEEEVTEEEADLRNDEVQGSKGSGSNGRPAPELNQADEVPKPISRESLAASKKSVV